MAHGRIAIAGLACDLVVIVARTPAPYSFPTCALALASTVLIVSA